MQTALSKIWTQIAMSISYDDIHYAISASRTLVCDCISAEG